MIRITSGIYRGRVIQMPEGVRPTQQKVRKAIFDILSDIEGLSFLELFAGSGAVSLEAFSRGASRAVLVEQESRCLSVIRANLEKLCISGCTVLPFPVIEALRLLSRAKEQFDLVFMDPPYLVDQAKKTLQALGEYDIVKPNGFVIVQHSWKEKIPDGTLRNYSLVKEADYGDTRLSFFQRHSV
jgi:16S rRNA (guanine966-N2)-methyltransferase